MKNIFKIFTFLSLIAFAGCVDLKFDEPPAQTFDTPEANTTIADLKAIHISGDFETLDGDKIIEGVVIADDETGNAYKSFFIQDATGGIEILVNDRNLYVTYPIGRKVFIKCNGLIMGDYGGNIRLGGSVEGDRVNGIEATLAQNYIVIGERDNVVEPKLTTIDQLSDKDLHTLIKLENVQFNNNDAGEIFAVDKVNTNRTIEDCNGNEIVARTSGYASFASQLTPVGKGTAIGVYTKFGNTKQFFIRTPDELPLNGDRCDGSGGGGGGGEDTTPNTTIAEIKALHTLGEFETLSGGKIIEGVIIGDDDKGNLYRQIIIQDATGGIPVRINSKNLSSKGLKIGTKIAVKCDGLDLGDYNNLIQIGTKNGDKMGGFDKNLINSVIIFGTKNNPITPTTKSITDLSTNDQSTLVTINNVEFASADSGKTFADGTGQKALNRTVLDCDNNKIIVRTSGFATFADNLTPTGNGTLTGIYSIFGDTKQIVLRTPSELDMSGTRCDGGGSGGGNGTVVFEETFDGITKFDILDLNGWMNIAEVGSDEQRWYANNFMGKEYASVSAYQAVEAENTIWLITPSFDATTAKTFKFESAQHHWKTGGLSIWISNDFDGSNLGTANWEQVNCTLPTDANSWYEWVPSGDIKLQDYFSTDNVRVAFKYEGNKDTNPTGFNIDNVIVEE